MKDAESREILRVLILTPDPAFAERVQSELKSFLQAEVEFEVCASLKDTLPAVDIALADEAALGPEPLEEFAGLKLDLGTAPFIYFCAEYPESDEDGVLKSLAADRLRKGTYSAKNLYNTVRRAVETARLEMELEQQNKRYQSLFFNGIDPAFFLNPDRTIFQVNDAFARTFGCDADALKGTSFRLLFHDEADYERIMEMLINQGKTNVDCECNFKPREKKGRFLGHLKISALREYGFTASAGAEPVLRFHGSLSNISYRERLRNIRQRADRVDMTYRLARTLAHEIRNPLTNINLALENVGERDTLPDDVRPMLEIIERSSQRINSLINQLLTSSERGKLRREDCDITGLIRDVIRESKDRADLVKVRIDTDFECESFLYNCDPQKLKLAISNLVGNAIEAIEREDGAITVGVYTEDDYLFIYVEDNGKGMTDDVKESLFDPFFTGKDSGVGLGLTATQTIIAEHAGEIEVESAADFGSTFTISLPLNGGQTF